MAGLLGRLFIAIQKRQELTHWLLSISITFGQWVMMA
jgi:hypothetical protein